MTPAGRLWRSVRRAGVFWLVGIFLAVGYVITPGADGSKVGGDGYYHVLLARALSQGNGFDPADGYRRFGDPYGYGYTDSGRARVRFHVGTGLLYAPLYGVGLLFASHDDRASFHHRLGKVSCFTAVLLSWMAIWMIQRIARRRLDEAWAWAVALTIFVGTPGLYYAWFHPSYTHAATAFAVAGVVLGTLRWMERGRFRDAVLVGAAIGLAALIRTQAVVICLVPAAACLDRVAREPSRWRAWVLQLLVAAATSSLVFSIQLGVWAASELEAFRPYGGTFLRLDQPALGLILFSSRNGLFPWSPVAFFALLGVVFVRPRILAASLLTVFVLQWWINASAWDWYASWSFGARRFTLLLAVFGAGLAALAATALARWPTVGARRGVAAVLFSVALMGFGMTVNEGYRPGPRWDVRDMLDVYAQAATGWFVGLGPQTERRRTAAGYLTTGLRPIYARTGNPFAFGMPWVQRGRWGLPVRDYDLEYGRFILFRDFKRPYPYRQGASPKDAFTWPVDAGSLTLDGSSLVVEGPGRLLLPIFRPEEARVRARLLPPLSRRGQLTLEWASQRRHVVELSEVVPGQWTELGVVQLHRGFNEVRFRLSTTSSVAVIDRFDFDVITPQDAQRAW